MARFLSNYSNKIDAKGRVSVPATYRTSIVSPNSENDFNGVVLYQALEAPCIEGVDMAYMDNLIASMGLEMGALDAEFDDLAAVLFGDSVELTFDYNGRIIIPAGFKDYAGIDNQAMFVGLGAKFQIWSPERFEEGRESRREKAKASIAALRRSMKERKS